MGKNQYSAFTSAAGEHYVVHKLFCLHFIALCARDGFPLIDIVAFSAGGIKKIGIQVKTTIFATRLKGRKIKSVGHLEFPLGYAAIERASKDTIFCFVDLKNGECQPDVYVLHQQTVAQFYKDENIRDYRFFRFHRFPKEIEQFKNNWNPIIEALS